MAVPSVRVWLLAARPKTLPAAAAPVLIGTSMAVAADVHHWWSALAALLAALFIQIGTNLANDYVDYKKGTDAKGRLGPTRVTQAGLASPGAVKAATIIVFAIAFAIGIYLVYRGGWPIVIIGLLSILFGILYSAGSWSLSYLGIADLFVLLFFGPVAVGGTYYVQALTVTPVVLVAGLAPGLFSTAILAVNNLRDVESDRRGGKRTLAVRFGASFARGEYLTAVILAGLLPPVVYYLFDAPPLIMVATATLLAAIPTISAVLSKSGRILNDSLAATGRLLLLYSILFSLGWLV